jgi:hypothetical protein
MHYTMQRNTFCYRQYVTVMFNTTNHSTISTTLHSTAQYVPLQYLFGEVFDQEGWRGVYCRGPLSVSLLTHSYLYGQRQGCTDRCGIGECTDRDRGVQTGVVMVCARKGTVVYGQDR